MVCAIAIARSYARATGAVNGSFGELSYATLASPSFEMKLPGGEHTVVEIAKLRDYCLNPSHPRGRHKARIFASTLRPTLTNAALLREELLRAAREAEAAKGEADEYGERYTVDFEVARGEQHAIVRSAWIIRRGERMPRLTSCYVLLD